MSPEVKPFLAELVLIAHLVVIGFNIFGLIAIPLGGWLNWRFVRIRWWRLLHVALLGVVALQALFGQACFLTVLQDELSGAKGPSSPLIMGLVNRLIYWPLPIWAFALGYVAVWIYVLALWRIVPPDRGKA